MSGRSRRIRSSISLARVCASSRLLPPSRPSVRKATSPSTVRRKRSSRGADPVASWTIRRTSAARLGLDLARGHRLGQRLEMGLHALRSPARPPDRVLDLLGDVVRLARATDDPGASRAATAPCRPVDVDEHEVVHLAHARHRERRGVGALAQRRILDRLDVHDDVGLPGALPRRRPRRRPRLRGPARRPTTAEPRSRRRRTGGRRPSASAAGAARPSARSSPIAARAASSASSGARSIRTSVLRLISRRGGEQHEHADEERGDRVGVRVARSGRRRGRRARRACRRSRCRSGARSTRAPGSCTGARSATRRSFASVDGEHEARGRRTRTRPR